MDEDPVEESQQLLIYVKSSKGVETLRLPKNAVDTSSVKTNSSDHSSIEGLVVSDDQFWPTSHAKLEGTGPRFYLLDERDRKKTDTVNMEAKLYLGVTKGEAIILDEKPIVFDLEDDETRGKKSPDDHYRLSELFQYDGSLYALKTRKGEELLAAYKVVYCDLEAGTLTEVCDFSDAARNLTSQEFDNNFEGAIVAKDGTLFLTADNEDFEAPEKGKDGKIGTPPGRGKRGITPIVSLQKVK